MTQSREIGLERRKVVDLNAGELCSLISLIVMQCLERFLTKVIPPIDPDEDVYWTTKQAAAFLGLSLQTIQEKKKRGLIEYEGQGRITRFTKAACKRYMREHGIPPASIAKRVENPVRVRYKKKNKK
jgi:excisionase family DNA binding protein